MERKGYRDFLAPKSESALLRSFAVCPTEMIIDLVPKIVTIAND